MEAPLTEAAASSNTVLEFAANLDTKYSRG